MTTREILTLQFGHYTNFVGAHFWNAQELSFDYTGTVKAECNHDILYREGRTPQREVTYTPRLLLADLQGSLKTLPEDGGLSQEFEDQSDVWHNVEKIEEPKCSKNEYLQDIDTEKVVKKEYSLETDVNTWTDFLYPRLHSRTINIVKDYHRGSETESFDVYSSGKSIWNGDFGETFSDNIRKYIEECDSMQGFHINFDCTDGFSGLTLGCMEHIADEYSKPILVHPIIPSYFTDNDPITQEEKDKSNLKDSVRLANIALSIEQLSQFAAFFVPLCSSEKGWRRPGSPRLFDYIKYDPKLYYHTSAILATTLDTLSQKYRHKSNSTTLSDFCADMSGYGRKMGAASVGLPFGIKESEYLIDHLNNMTKPLYTTITPSCKVAQDKIFQMVTVRGIPESYLKAPMNKKEYKHQSGLPAYGCNNLQEMFKLYIASTNYLSVTDVTIAERPFNVKTPYPKIFSSALNEFGFLNDETTDCKVQSIPVIAAYHNGNFMENMIEKLHREAGRIKFAKLHKFKAEGLEEFEWKESLDSMAEFKNNYEEDYEL